MYFYYALVLEIVMLGMQIDWLLKKKNLSIWSCFYLFLSF